MSAAPSIEQQVGEFKEQTAGRLPAAVAAAFGEHLAALSVAGVPAATARPGTAVSDVTLSDATGELTTLLEVTGDRPAVLVFYRGVWCPFCNIALRSYSEQLYPELEARGVTLVAVSPQKPDGSLTMAEKHGLRFPVMSDPGNALAAQLGTLMPSKTESLRQAERQVGLDLSAVNADGTEGLPMAAVAVIDADHVLRWIDVQPDYTRRTEAADILAAVDEIIRG